MDSVLFNKIKDISSVLAKPFCVVLNPITNTHMIFTNVDMFNIGQPNINNYNEISGVEVSDMLSSYSFNKDNVFDFARFEQECDKKNKENYKFMHNDWVWVNVELKSY